MGDRLKGKVAVLTGACGGLGLVFSKTFLNEGAKVILTDITEKMMTAAEAELSKEYPGKYKIMKLDVTSHKEVNELMEAVDKEFGKIDILFNIAGGSLFTPKKLEEITEKDWDKVLDVNLKGTFFCCQAVVPHMRKNKYGRIITMSSIGGRTPSVVTGAAYAAAKGGVIALTRRLALEVGPDNITVNSVAPGTVLSGERMINLWNELSDEKKKETVGSIPLGRQSTAEEQATVALFLASDDSAYMTGCVLDINGGRFMG